MKRLTGIVWIVAGLLLVSGIATAGKEETLYRRELTLKLRNGQDMKLSDLSGKPSVLFFYNSVCGCRPYRELLNKTYISYKDKGVQVIGVGIRENEDKFLKFANSEDFSFPSGFDATSGIAKDCGAYSVPVTIFVTKDGRIARRTTGYMKEPEIKAEIEKLL